jgi:hypothetical protein
MILETIFHHIPCVQIGPDPPQKYSPNRIGNALTHTHNHPPQQHHHLTPFNHYNGGLCSWSAPLVSPKSPYRLALQRETPCAPQSPCKRPPATPSKTGLTSSPGLDVHTQNCIPMENQRSDFPWFWVGATKENQHQWLGKAQKYSPYTFCRRDRRFHRNS